MLGQCRREYLVICPLLWENKPITGLLDWDSNFSSQKTSVGHFLTSRYKENHRYLTDLIFNFEIIFLDNCPP